MKIMWNYKKLLICSRDNAGYKALYYEDSLPFPRVGSKEPKMYCKDFQS